MVSIPKDFEKSIPIPRPEWVDAHTWHRFWCHVKPGWDGCLVWSSDIDRGGYGVFIVGGIVNSAHRLVCRWRDGTIHKGSHVHHTCRTRNCVNPEHLVVLTANAHRLVHGIPSITTFCVAELSISEQFTWLPSGTNPTCRKGHLRTSENTRIYPNGNVMCIQCRRAWEKKNAERIRANRRLKIQTDDYKIIRRKWEEKNSEKRRIQKAKWEIEHSEERKRCKAELYQKKKLLLGLDI